MDPKNDKVNWLACSDKTIASARALYEAYIANSDGLNYQGLPCPAWPDLTDAVKSHWCATVKAARVLANNDSL